MNRYPMAKMELWAQCDSGTEDMSRNKTKQQSLKNSEGILRYKILLKKLKPRNSLKKLEKIDSAFYQKFHYSAENGMYHI